MKKYSLEFSVGIFVLIGLVCLGYMTIRLGKMEVVAGDGYTLNARFASVTGLKVGAGVEISGVPVGKVTGVSLNDEYYARVSMQLDNQVRLGDDSIASVKTSGLIGDKYISISRGASSTLLADGDELTETESAVDIEALISKYVFGGAQ
ncbi:MAG: outer membrane lipid asymmetry maintenance protein MlaD [Desulfovibrio sp.]|jgi:phospholipid/cholesterol/gamma-HCH transport system substrate-binding protein|nr:outer membrane lipid asymmetry maintenance protein MlaD [Desulfovibrio sp.]